MVCSNLGRQTTNRLGENIPRLASSFHLNLPRCRPGPAGKGAVNLCADVALVHWTGTELHERSPAIAWIRLFWPLYLPFRSTERMLVETT
jgi:hypothetical protein